MIPKFNLEMKKGWPSGRPFFMAKIRIFFVDKSLHNLFAHQQIVEVAGDAGAEGVASLGSVPRVSLRDTPGY